MDEETPKAPPDEEVCSPKPLAFTIDFGDGKNVDLERHKTLVEKYKNRHKRGQSLSKIEANLIHKTGNVPRKSSFQSEGYFSSDEKNDKSRSTNKVVAKRDLTLQLKNKMTQSFPNSILSNIASPETEIKDIPCPELDIISPISLDLPLSSNNEEKTKQLSSPQSATQELLLVDIEDDNFIDGTEFDFDKSDTVSDAGTYTLDADNYSEAQKIRMSIDREFKIDQISGIEKTQEYLKSLTTNNYLDVNKSKCLNLAKEQSNNDKVLSPILSPTQNLSITEKLTKNKSNNDDSLNQTFSVAPRVNLDHGSVTSVTSSGIFRTNKVIPSRKLSLTKSEVHFEEYIDDKTEEQRTPKQFSYKKVVTPKLSANVINVQNISIKSKDMDDSSDVEEVRTENVPYLPPAVGGLSGKNSPSKIPSPIHTLSRPRSRNSSQTFDLSDSSIETESYLKSTQNCINSLQKHLSFDSDQDSDLDRKYGVALNNTAQSLLKHKTSHTRHNSLDGKGIKISNKLEHFQTKNLQVIDQTYVGRFSQYGAAAQTAIQKIQNSPNNSPVRRSSSFTTKNHINLTNANKTTNLLQNDLIRYNKPPRIDRNKYGDTESSSEEDFDKNLSKRRDASSLTNTRYNRAFSLRRGRLDSDSSSKCPTTPEVRRKFQTPPERAVSMDRRPTTVTKANEVQSRYLTGTSTKASSGSPKSNASKTLSKATTVKQQPGAVTKATTGVVSRTDSGRFSIRAGKGGADGGKSTRKDGSSAKKSGGRSNSSLTSREVDFQNWKRRKSYDPIKAAAEGKRREMEKKQTVMTQSYNERNHGYECDSSPSHSSSVHRSQSFHGTAAMEQLISSEEEEDMTLSADEGFSPPTPSPCELSPARMSLRNTCRERILN